MNVLSAPAVAALALVTTLVVARPTRPVALALALGTAVFAAGVFVPIRRAIPSYNRLLGVYAGVFGLARVTSEGGAPASVVLVLIGFVTGLDLVYRRLAERSVSSR